MSDTDSPLPITPMRPSRKHSLSDDDEEDSKRAKLEPALLSAILGDAPNAETQHRALENVTTTILKDGELKNMVIICQGWRWAIHSAFLKAWCSNLEDMLQDSCPEVDAKTHLPLLNMSAINPLVVDMVVEYWYTRRTNIRNPPEFKFGEYTPSDDAPSAPTLPKLQVHFGMATMAHLFGDTRLYEVVMAKFRAQLNTYFTLPQLFEAVKTFYHHDYDDKHHIQAFRDIIAYIAYKRELHHMGHPLAMEVHKYVTENPRFLEDLKRVRDADSELYGEKKKGFAVIEA